MKRSSATINKRKRIDNNDTFGMGASHGALTVLEIEAILQTYADGSRGELLIGLQEEKRIITMLLPPQPDADAAIRQTMRAAKKIKRLGCDGYIFVRRVRLSGLNTETPSIIMVVDEHTMIRNRQSIFPIEPSAHTDIDYPSPVNDVLGSTMAKEWDV